MGESRRELPDPIERSSQGVECYVADSKNVRGEFIVDCFIDGSGWVLELLHPVLIRSEWPEVADALRSAL